MRVQSYTAVHTTELHSGAVGFEADAAPEPLVLGHVTEFSICVPFLSTVV